MKTRISLCKYLTLLDMIYHNICKIFLSFKNHSCTDLISDKKIEPKDVLKMRMFGQFTSVMTALAGTVGANGGLISDVASSRLSSPLFILACFFPSFDVGCRKGYDDECSVVLM